MLLNSILLCGLTAVRYFSDDKFSPVGTATVTAAYTYSSIIFLPCALFNPLPGPGTLTGQVTTVSSTTYYPFYELGFSFFDPINAPHTLGE